MSQWSLLDPDSGQIQKVVTSEFDQAAFGHIYAKNIFMQVLLLLFFLILLTRPSHIIAVDGGKDLIHGLYIYCIYQSVSDDLRHDAPL